MSLTDNVTNARHVNAVFELRRNHLLRSFNWSFAMKRASLPALADAPVGPYAVAYQLPADCLRVVQVGDVWAIPGLADYMGGPDSELYRISGRTIETDFSAPLALRYVRKVTNAGEFDDCFVEVLAADLAHQVCVVITDSSVKKKEMKDDLRDALLQAVRANAIELPPQQIPDDSWIISRL